MSRLTIIVAATKSNGIGQNGSLPWRLPKELAYFTRVTSSAPPGHTNAVIMGRNTWESIPKKFRPLPNRMNVIISQNKDYELSSLESAPAHLHPDFETAVTQLSGSESIHRGFVIGGASLYSQGLALPFTSSSAFVDRILLTRITSPPFDECDVFMPDFLGEGSGNNSWQKSSHADLQTWVGFEVPEGTQEEKGVEYEFQMWTREQ